MSVKSCLLLVAFACGPLAAAEPGRVSLQVTEPIGVHRDGSPVHFRMQLPQAVPTSTRFRLLLAGKPVTAQFRPASADAESDRWWIDFIARSPPFETLDYVVEFGADVEPAPERPRGHKLIVKPEVFVVSNAPYLDWTVPRDFRGFLRSVDFTPPEHLRPDSIGLTIRDRDGKSHQLGGEGTTAKVVRQGTMAVALRFEKAETDPSLAEVRWSADLVFPGPVSWADLRLKIDDPKNRVAQAGLQLRLNLDPPTGRARTLVELGAAGTVYRSLTGNSQVELRADASRNASPWQILRGTERSLRPFVVAAHDSPRPEGWAHVMDRKRCLAIAFDRFGQDGEDRLNVQADGTLTASRRFAPAASGENREVKAWRTWLHFVHFPPQQSAATDPRMMQSPLILKQVAP